MKRLWTVMGLTALAIGCTSRDAYLSKVTGSATQDEVRKELGSPKEERSLSNGETMWLYQYTQTESHGMIISCHEYQLRFDAQKVLRQWKGSNC